MPDIAQRLSSVPETDSALDLKVWLEKSMGDLRQDLYMLKYGDVHFDDIITKSPWADVRAFGAIGDGVTDDTAAIVAAIAAVTTDGGAVLLSGNFKTTSSITVPANVSIIGLNPVSSKITYNVAGYAFKVTGSNAIIKSIRFDIGTTATGAINVNADSNSIINVKILNNYFNGSDKTVASRIAVLFSGSIAPGVYPIYYCWAEGCYFDAWNTGIKTTNPSGNVNAMANAEYLNHNTFRNIGSYAIDLAGSSLENVLIGNWADSSPGAVGLHLTGIRNMVLGFHAEMGAGAKTFIIDSGANSNWLIVNDNSPGTSEDNGSGNFLITPSSAQFRLLNKTPASATAAGVSGTLCWDTSYVYVCVATNSWKRVAIAAW